MKNFFIVLFVLIAATVMGGCLDLKGIFPFSNQAPVIISEPILTATEDQLYSYQVEATDPNGDALIYSSIIKPEGMNVNSENGLLIWTPTNEQVGINKVEIEIFDGKLSVAQSFEIEVYNVNNAPQILSYSPGSLNVVVNEGDSIKFEIQAHDIDLNATLNYKWFLNGKLVLDSNISGNDSKSSWIYSAGYGDYSQKIVKVFVSDGELQDYVQWGIIINDIAPPAQPILNAVTSPTNISSQILSGTKETNSSVWINGAEVISVNPDTTWSYSYNLSEGTNNILITSHDAAGNESFAVTAAIEYDPDTYVNIENATGIEDGTETHPFDTIVEGIEAATPGKSVVVLEGTYNEKLIINKGITLQGAGEGSTIISGLKLEYTGGNLITVTADDVTISGFTIDGGSKTDMGIYSDSSSSIEISGNLIQSHQDSGILYYRTSDYYPSGVYVYNNEICHNSKNGIKVTGAGSGIIEGNIIRNSSYGIKASNDAFLEVKKNNIHDNSDSGIFCRDNSSLSIWENEIRANGYGINIGAFSSDTTNPDIGGGDRGGTGRNNITGNTTHGVSNMTNHNISAKYNWWGDADGPKYPYHTLSSGDWAFWSELSGNIIFEDYLSEPQTF
jgi:parallel beta-helix repeat protein